VLRSSASLVTHGLSALSPASREQRTRTKNKGALEEVEEEDEDKGDRGDKNREEQEDEEAEESNKNEKGEEED
jgi:hypothetical protein